MNVSSARVLLFVATLAVLPAGAAAGDPAFLAEDRADFDSARGSAPQKVWDSATKRAGFFGEQESFEVLDYLFDSQNFALLSYFAAGFNRSSHPTTAANNNLQRWLIGRFDAPSSVAEVLPALRTVDNPELAELLYRDVASLAKARADRRKRCRIEVLEVIPESKPVRNSSGAFAPVVGYGSAQAKPTARVGYALTESGSTRIRWRYNCPGQTDDPMTDVDGRTWAFLPYRDPRWAEHRVFREDASLAAIARVTLPGFESRLGPLLADISLPAKADWKAVGTKPDGIFFPNLSVPIKWAGYFRDHRYTPGTKTLLAILDEYEPGATAVLRNNDARNAIRVLLSLLPLEPSREANEALGRWIAHGAGIEDAMQRRAWFDLINKLGPVLPDDQVDLVKLKTQVLGRLPYDEVAQISRMFDSAEAQNRSLRELTAASIAAWLARPQLDPRILDYLMAHVTNIDEVPAQGEPMLIAAARGDGQAFRALLARGANVNIRDTKGMTALGVAVSHANGQRERPEMVAALISRGADVNASPAGGGTPVHGAVDSPESMKLLLAAGAKPDVPLRNGEAPLTYAIRAGNLETVRLLLDAGADPNRTNVDGSSPYLEAVGQKSVSTDPKWQAVLDLLTAHGGRITLAQEVMKAKAELMMKMLRR